MPTELPEFAPFQRPMPDFAAPRSEWRPGRRGGERCATRWRRRSFPPICWTASPARARPKSISKRWRQALAQDKQVLILLPEIALTVQFLERFAARFGVRPAEWHSDLSQKERRRTYRAVMNGEARVVVGARSSLFLPFPRAGPGHRRRRTRTGLQAAGRRHLSRPRHGGGAGADRGLPGGAGQRHAVAGKFRQCPKRALHASETGVAAWRGGNAGGAADRSAPGTRCAGRRTESPMAVAAAARRAGKDAGGRRTGDAVPQPPGLCAADLVRSLRPQIHLPALLGLAGGAQIQEAAGLSSMRL